MSHEAESTIKLVPSRTDADYAAELRTQVEAALAPVLVLLSKAKVDNFEVAFSLAPDWRGQISIQTLTISKRF